MFDNQYFETLANLGIGQTMATFTIANKQAILLMKNPKYAHTCTEVHGIMAYNK